MSKGEVLLTEIMLIALLLCGGCGTLPTSLGDFNDGLRYGVMKSMEDPDAAGLSVGYRNLEVKGENGHHRFGIDSDLTYFREQLRRDTLVDEYFSLAMRATWEWDVWALGGAPVYVGIGTGAGVHSGDGELFGGCSGHLSQRAYFGWGFLIPYYQHGSTWNVCNPNSGQDHWGLDLQGAIRWLAENLFRQ